ncbi:protein of unknown function [Pseudodesulfovibrio profundus]|uniref:Uncharacterized protein n=2 Tax=Pseudodesulfovibrio profundus TaxID=57320 RepID=A0A2C8F5C8_9BACT|nr:protein of unknown function [Pseudodesulfovibrio profundus]
MAFCTEPHEYFKKCDLNFTMSIDFTVSIKIEVKQQAQVLTSRYFKMAEEMKNEAHSPSLPLDPAKTVVKELRMLAESHPNRNNGMTARDIEIQTFLRGKITLTHRTVGDTLPLPTDAPAYYYVLGVLGRARAKDESVRTIIVNVRDVVDGIGLTRAKSSYDSVRNALRRYSRLNVEIKSPAANGTTEFRLFGVSPVGAAAMRLDFSQDYLDALESGENQVHYLALRHILPLGGLAMSLYALMQTHLFHGNKLDVGARRFCRTWLGEERGGDIPVSRAFSAYVRPRLQEIADKTGWLIAAKKIGRADDARYVFSTKSIPQAFAVVKNGIEADTASALDKLVDETNKRQAAQPVAKESASDTPEPIPASTVSPTVLSALPPASRSDKAFITALAALPEADAIDVIEYVKSNAKKSFGSLLNHLIHNKGLKSLVAEIKEKKAEVVPDGARKYRIAYKYLKDRPEHEIREYADEKGHDADDMLRWFSTWKAQGK